MTELGSNLKALSVLSYSHTQSHVFDQMKTDPEYQLCQSDSCRENEKCMRRLGQLIALRHSRGLVGRVLNIVFVALLML